MCVTRRLSYGIRSYSSSLISNEVLCRFTCRFSYSYLIKLGINGFINNVAAKVQLSFPDLHSVKSLLNTWSKNVYTRFRNVSRVKTSVAQRQTSWSRPNPVLILVLTKTEVLCPYTWSWSWSYCKSLATYWLNMTVIPIKLRKISFSGT